MLRWAQAPARHGLLLAVCVAVLLWHGARPDDLRAYRGLQPAIPETAQPGKPGPLYVDLPASYVAPLYLSPVDGGLVSEWPGGTLLTALGSSFDDGRVGWQLVRDPSGNEAWVADLFLNEQLSVVGEPGDDDYVSSVRWDGEIAYCANPTGGPPGLDGDAFVALVERVAARWQEVGEGSLPLSPRGRCENDPTLLGDGMNAVGWVDDLGLVIAGQAWPNADQGTVTEIDIRLSRGYFMRLQERDPSRTLERCVFSTLVHEFGHLLGLDHPRSRLLPSSMQGVGASRCDKGQPSASDKETLLRRYTPTSFPSPQHSAPLARKRERGLG